MKNQNVTFRAGKNIAMKVPSHQYEQTVAFYKNVLGLSQLKQEIPSVVFKFGDKNLWIDNADDLGQSEIWLEICCNDIKEANKYLESKKVKRCDDVEKLPDDFQGFWIASPCDIIHLISKD
jgi:hypothetical protein